MCLFFFFDFGMGEDSVPLDRDILPLENKPLYVYLLIFLLPFSNRIANNEMCSLWSNKGSLELIPCYSKKKTT